METIDVKSIVQLQQQTRDMFIAARTKEETEFTKWYTGLLKCSQEHILDKLPFDYHNLSIQSLIPEWYVERPNKEIAHQQVEKLREMQEAANKIVYEYNVNEYNRVKAEFDALQNKGGN